MARIPKISIQYDHRTDQSRWEYYGDLDTHFEADQLASVIDALVYTMDDQRKNKPNPTKIPFDGDPYKNLSSYRGAVKTYLKYKLDKSAVGLSNSETRNQSSSIGGNDEDGGQRIGLERDMQAALRLGIEQLEKGLYVIDEGVE